MDALVAVRRRIAEALAGAVPDGVQLLGGVELRPHQADAVHRLRAALDACGGALLADSPGLGKTYVALAIARESNGAVVIAPAALRTQWQRSAALAGVRIEWCSFETLSRRGIGSESALLVVDEAHRLRNPATRCYEHASALAVGKRVLLLSATPVHNRADDLCALLALFLGAAAWSVPAASLARMIVRREADPRLLPLRSGTRWLHPVHSAGIGARLRKLPPPLPAADGREAAMLVRFALAHAWSSSVAALDSALRRAIHRAHAIDDSLAAGRWPTRRELRAWATSEASSQLAFPEIVAAPARGSIENSRAALARHLKALGDLRRAATDARERDTASRATLLKRVMCQHPGATVLAFSCFASTVDALWHALRLEAGVAAITARGVQSAGGGLRRADILSALATAPAAGQSRMPLRLVLSTDLLGEGLDLRAASVIVHLDQPWTPARLDQREGRATRLSSPHASVFVYALRAPRAAESVIALAARLREKRLTIDAGAVACATREALLALTRPWLDVPSGGPAMAAAVAGSDGWIAVIRDTRGRQRVIAAVGNNAVVEDDADLLALLRGVASAATAPLDRSRLLGVRRALRQWLRADASATLAGVGEGGSSERAALLRRLDEGAREVPLRQRAALQRRVAMARDRLAAARGAGVERSLATAARETKMDDVLSAVERLAKVNAPATSGGARTLALLVLTSAASSAETPTDRQPEPTAHHSTASPGTAAPR